MARRRKTPLEDAASISASLESFDDERLLSHGLLHSEIESEQEFVSDSEHSSTPWSPPAWRKGTSGWQQRHNLAPPDSHSGRGGGGISRSDCSLRSRSSRSPMYESAGEGYEEDDTLLPANVPLPASPEKETPRNSVEPSVEPALYHADDEQRISVAPTTDASIHLLSEKDGSVVQPSNNYIRFAVRAEVQHRTELLDNILHWCKGRAEAMLRSPWRTLFAVLGALLAFMTLLRTPEAPPTPDILRATQVARTFEPLIYYSEGGIQQVSHLQDTGVAVWDLAESIRTKNLTSGKQIVEQLEDLSKSLDSLVIELTRFFVNVDGDIDSILIVMDWAKKRLQSIEKVPDGTLTIMGNNFNSLLDRAGALNSPDGRPRIVGMIIRELFGRTTLQKNTETLQRTFNDFLNVLEESINNELQHSVVLFGLFEAVERQFLNLHQTAIRETDLQEREEGETLSSLWMRTLGNRAAEVRKFEKNKALLSSLRSRTLQNKHVLKDHNGKLLQMKENLEVLRRKITSQIVRGNYSTGVAAPVQDQIQGLDDTYSYLREIRERQKVRTREMMYGTTRGREYTAVGGVIVK